MRESEEMNKDEIEQMLKLFKYSIDILCIASLDGYFEFFNPALEKITGYDKKELLGRRFLDFIHPDDRDATISELGKLSKGFSTIFFDNRYKCKDGSTKWIRWNAFPAPEEGLTYAVGRDVTKLKQLEGEVKSRADKLELSVQERTREIQSSFDALQESEERLKRIFSSVQDTITVSNIDDGRIIDTNAKLTGYTRDEMIGKKASNLGLWIDPGDRERWVNAIRSNNLVQDFEAKLRRKDGTVISTSISTNLIMWNGKPHLLSVTRDITDRRRKEEALQESEAKYRTLVDNSLQGIVIAQGSPLRLAFVNPAMGKMLGYNPSELTSLSPKEIEGLVHPEDRALFFGRFMDRLRGKSAPPSYEVRAIRKDGEVAWLELFSSRIELNEEPAVQAAFVDVTGRKLAEKSVATQRDRAMKFLDVVQAIIIVIQVDETVTLINRKGREILGYANEEIVGKNWFDTFIPVRERKRTRDVFGRLMKGEIKPVEFFENTVLTKGGEERSIAWHNDLLRDENGIIYATLSYGQDMTGRIDVVEVKSEADAIKARVQTMAMAETLGFNYLDQEKIAFTTLELARNALHFAGEGKVTVQHAERSGKVGVEITVEDHGPGIANLELALKGGYSTADRLGEGLLRCRMLMDEFDIKTKVGEGTKVKIAKWL
jgi:PAS domain S-box-containing protein